MRKLTNEEYILLLNARTLLFELNSDRCDEIDNAEYENDVICKETDTAFHSIDKVMSTLN